MCGRTPDSHLGLAVAALAMGGWLVGGEQLTRSETELPQLFLSPSAPYRCPDVGFASETKKRKSLFTISLTA